MAWRAARCCGLAALLVVSRCRRAAGGRRRGRRAASSPPTTADYFGFDLRAEQNFSLEQCKSDLPRRPLLPRLHLQHQGQMVLPQIRLQPAEAVLRRGRRQGRQRQRRARHRRAGRTHLLPVLDGRRSRPLPPNVTTARSPSAKAAWPRWSRPAEQALLTGDPHAPCDSYTGRRRDLAATTARCGSALPGPRWPCSRANGDETRAVPAQRHLRRLERPTSCRAPPTARAEALAVIAAGLDRRDLFRPALQAYEASLALVNSAEVEADYDDLKARKGFRVVEHTIDADSAAPRVCVQFSEDAGQDRRRLCALRDARRRSAQGRRSQGQADLRRGPGARRALQASPSAPACRRRSARCWRRRSTLDIYVQDRAPSVRFTGDSFVLPATARRGIPVVSVNIDERRPQALPHRRPRRWRSFCPAPSS